MILSSDLHKIVLPPVATTRFPLGMGSGCLNKRSSGLGSTPGPFRPPLATALPRTRAHWPAGGAGEAMLALAGSIRVGRRVLGERNVYSANFALSEGFGRSGRHGQ